MSSDLEAEKYGSFCESCGIAEVDGIELKKCDDCDLVRYCSDECQQEHRPHHESKCKERAAELRDEILFRQPESNHHGDCPICCVPLPIHGEDIIMMSCCSKSICKGCVYFNTIRELEGNLQEKCPFCRQPWPESDEEYKMNRMKRVQANDPTAIIQTGLRCELDGDYDTAFQYYTKAAALGDADAHNCLSIMYMKGECVEKDEGKELYHTTEAAIRGHPAARYQLACIEFLSGKFERAVKHWIIAAKFHRSLPKVKRLCRLSSRSCLRILALCSEEVISSNLISGAFAS